MHVDLTYSRTTRPILERIDKFVFDLFHPDGHGVPPDEHEALRQLFYLDSFRAQFKEFLTQHNLPTGLCDEDEQWLKFLTAYAGVIEDGSLIYKGEDLKMVSAVRFTKAPAKPGPDARIPFTIQWTIILTDGRELEFLLHPNWKLLGSIMTETAGK